MVLSKDLQSKVNSNIGSLSSDESMYYFALHEKHLEDDLYAVSKINVHKLGSLKGVRTELIELIELSKANQTFLTNQKIYKAVSILFFIIGSSIISLFLLTNDLNSKGILLKTQGEFDDAIRLLKQTLEINPEDLSALINTGHSFSLKGDLNDAKIYYDKAIKLYPKSAWVMYNIGWYSYLQNNYDEALKYYETAIELEPNYSAAHYNLACVFSLMNEFDRSIESLKKAIELSKIAYSDRARLDADFDNVRNKSEFINLIKYN